MVSLQLRALPAHELRRNGRIVPISAYPENTLTIYDLRDEWRANLVDPFEVMHLHIPMTALDELAGEFDRRRTPGLDCPPQRGCEDTTMRLLAEALLPVLAGRRRESQLFTDSLLRAMREHVAIHYGGLQPSRTLGSGTLARWQLSRLEEFVRTRIDTDLSLDQLANECRLSVSYFIRAFKRSTGLTPHQWLLRTRIDVALRLLRRDAPIARIALDCGFADQSHFTRVFTRQLGMSPGRWRREHGIREPAEAP